jgi:glycosyltransferase involved in cell wall biosynthesis
MRIVHLLAPAPIGGLERVVQGLTIGQQRRGHDVLVVAVGEHSMTADHPFRAPLDAANVPIRQVVLRPRAYLDERARIAAICREFAPEVVHAHGNRPDVVDSPVVRSLGIGSVSTHHGWTYGSLRNRVYEYLHTRSLRRGDAVIAVSESIARRLEAQGVPPDRLYVVQNAWAPVAEPLSRAEARRLLDLPPDARLVGSVGRLSREKGIDVLVDAMGLLRNDDVVACVIGDGAEREREQAHAERVAARIIWKGMVPSASRLIKAFDVFVQSSRTEGTPIALLEAIAAEAPVVATRVGGVPDVVSGSEAILVPSENPAALADAIQRVLAKPEAAAERVRRAKLRLSSAFNSESWLDRHEEIYARAAAQRRRAASAP